MAYIAQSDLEGRVPSALIVQALDDDGDGAADSGAWDKLEADVEEAINGRLAATYTTPLTGTLPAVVLEAAKVLAAEAIYLRRGYARDANPWTAQADAMRKRLEQIGSGEIPLTATATPAASGGAVIGEDARMYDDSGRLMV